MQYTITMSGNPEYNLRPDRPLTLDRAMNEAKWASERHPGRQMVISGTQVIATFRDGIKETSDRETTDQAYRKGYEEGLRDARRYTDVGISAPQQETREPVQTLGEVQPGIKASIIRRDLFPPGWHPCPNCHRPCYCAEKDDGMPCSHQETHNCSR